MNLVDGMNQTLQSALYWGLAIFWCWWVSYGIIRLIARLCETPYVPQTIIDPTILYQMSKRMERLETTNKQLLKEIRNERKA